MNNVAKEKPFPACSLKMVLYADVMFDIFAKGSINLRHLMLGPGFTCELQITATHETAFKDEASKANMLNLQQ